MGSILDNYKRQLEEDRLNENNDLSSLTFNDELENIYSQGADADAVAKRINELREDPNDMENVFKAFNQQYPRVSEKSLSDGGNIKVDTDVTIAIKRAYCPSCGKEIISKSPVMYNPFTLEKIAKYECECGAKFNFDSSYPRIVYMDSKGNEIKAFAE